jgi:hypothetical protein
VHIRFREAGTTCHFRIHRDRFLLCSNAIPQIEVVGDWS